MASCIPYLSKNIVDGLSFDLSKGLMVLTCTLGVFWTFEKIAAHLQEIVFFPVINTCIQNIQENVILHVHQIAFQDYQKLSMPELISAIKRISQSARAFVKICFLMCIPTSLKFLVIAILASQLGWLGLTFSLSFLVCFFVLYQGIKWYVAERAEAWATTDAVTMRMNDSIYNTKTVRSFFNFEQKTIGNLLNQEAELWYNTNFKLHTIHILIGLIVGLGFTTILGFALFSIHASTLTIGDFVLLKAQLIAVFVPFKNLSTEIRQLAEGTIDIQKIINILEIPKQKSNLTAITNKQSQITQTPKLLILDNIYFAYDLNSPLLQNVTLEIEAGEKIAIIGKNGQGKSSIAGLISGLMIPEQGQVLIHGLPIQFYAKNILNKLVHCIPQDLKIFNLSLRENLCYGLSEPIHDSKLYEMLEAVELKALIAALPAGLESKMGEFGIRLSGGEKKRLALARALLLKPDILILDETLDALNLESETALLKKLSFVSSILIIITQRLSILERMDYTFKLENGKLIKLDQNKDAAALPKNTLETENLNS